MPSMGILPYGRLELWGILRKGHSGGIIGSQMGSQKGPHMGYPGVPARGWVPRSMPQIAKIRVCVLTAPDQLDAKPISRGMPQMAPLWGPYLEPLMYPSIHPMAHIPVYGRLGHPVGVQRGSQEGSDGAWIRALIRGPIWRV